jgi:hypothetical protein
VQTTTNRKGDDSAVGGRSTETIPDLARLGYFVASGVIKIMERGVSWFSIAADVLGPDSTPSQKAAYAKRLSAANGGGVPKVGDTIKIPDTTA